MAISSLLDRLPLEVRCNMYQQLFEEGVRCDPYHMNIIPGLTPFVKVQPTLIDKIGKTFGHGVLLEIKDELFRARTASIFLVEKLHGLSARNANNITNWIANALRNESFVGSTIWPKAACLGDQNMTFKHASTLHIIIELQIPRPLELFISQITPPPRLVLSSLAFLARILTINRNLHHLCINIEYRSGFENADNRITRVLYFLNAQIELFRKQVPNFCCVQLSIHQEPGYRYTRRYRYVTGKLPKGILWAPSEWGVRPEAERFKNSRICCFYPSLSHQWKRTFTFAIPGIYPWQYMKEYHRRTQVFRIQRLTA